MKKILLVFLVVILASFLFIGCLPTTPTEGEGEGESEESEVMHGPAPNSGDDILGGPGWF